MSRYFTARAIALFALTACTGALQAGMIAIPNGSFESPQTTYAVPYVNAWQQVPSPDFYVTGVFSNQPPTDPYHIDNCDGDQALFLFATPQVSLFQDYESTDWLNPTPTHAFNATFEVGKSYTLTVGVLGGTNLAYPMKEGTTLELSLYYRESGTNRVVAATVITNSGYIFSNATHFVDFQVRVPTVQASDEWAGQHLGVQMLSAITDTNLMGGYWDLDNVRLFAAGAPALLAPASTNGQFTSTLESEPGLRFEILASTNVTLPLSNWTSLGILTNSFGTTPFLDSATNASRRFYRARQLP